MKHRVDILSKCIRETTHDIEAMDAVKTVWRLESSLAKIDIPFYSGSVASLPRLTSRNCATKRRLGTFLIHAMLQSPMPFCARLDVNNHGLCVRSERVVMDGICICIHKTLRV
jgi:hypothetical protein